jgi:uncharacterized membrane protein
MRLLYPLLIACLLTSLPLASAQEIRSYEVNVTILAGGDGFLSFLEPTFRSKEEVSLNFVNTGETVQREVSYPFAGRIEDLLVSSPSQRVNFQIELRSDRTYVTAVLERPLSPGESRTVRYEYTTPHSLVKFSKGWRETDTYLFTTTHSLLANVKHFQMALFLPEGYGIAEEGITPPPTQVDSDGRRVILRWELTEPIPPQLREFRITVFYEPFREYLIVLYPLAALIALLLLFLAYRYLREEGLSLQDYLDRKKYVYDKIDILKEDEQEILKLIIEKDGIDQREIQRKTDFSKTKVSKILSELEKRGTIRKEQIGRRNKIYMTEKFKK